MSGAPADREERWEVHGREDVWRTSAPFAVRLDTVSAPATPEQHFTRLVVEHPGAVVVLALDDDQRVAVLEQYRHPVARRLVELPAGLLDQPGEDPLAAAKRELREEAGLEAGLWTHLLTTHTSPGIVAERIEIYLAQGLSRSDPPGDYVAEHEEADMTLSWAAVDDLLEGVLTGRITDGPLAHAVMAYTIGRSPRRRGDEVSGGSSR